MPKQLPEAQVWIFAPSDTTVKERILPLVQSLMAKGVKGINEEDDLRRMTNDDRIITYIGVGRSATETISTAIKTGIGLRRRVALIAPDIPDTYATPRPGIGGRHDHRAAVLRWRRNIQEGILDVVTVGPNGEMWRGTEFLDHIQSPVPEEKVENQLRNPVALRTIVKFVTKDTSSIFPLN